MTMPLERIKKLLEPHPDWFPGEPLETRYNYWGLSDSEMILLGQSAILHLKEGATFTEDEIEQIRKCLSDQIRHLRFQERPRFGESHGPGIHLRAIAQLGEVLREFNDTLHPPIVTPLRLHDPPPEPPKETGAWWQRFRHLFRSTPAGASL